MNTSERLTQLVNELAGGNRKAFADRIGVPTNTYKYWIQRGKIEADVIARACPEISLQWLVLGEGPMYDYQCENSKQFSRVHAPASDNNDHPISVSPVSDEQPSLVVPSPEEQPSSGALLSPRPYGISEPSPCLQVSEGEAVDRALLNLLLREKAALEARLASKDQELELLRQRNLQLEKDNAVMSDRLDNAEKWYRKTFQK